MEPIPGDQIGCVLLQMLHDYAFHTLAMTLVKFDKFLGRFAPPREKPDGATEITVKAGRHVLRGHVT